MRYANLVIGLLGLAAAVLAIYAASIEIRPSLDTMDADMAEQSLWALRAAYANALATGLLVIVLALELRKHN